MYYVVLLSYTLDYVFNKTKYIALFFIFIPLIINNSVLLIIVSKDVKLYNHRFQNGDHKINIYFC